jgi:RNA polymerase sigma-54 factor
MEMDLDLSQDYSGQQQLRVSPRLVAASYILELSSQELQQQIANELSDNPALELVDVPTCQICGSELQGSICPWCIQRQRSENTTQDLQDDPASSAYDDPPPPASQRLTDEEFDPLTQVASEETLAEKLLTELGAQLDDVQDLQIAEYLVGSLDDKGYLSTSLEEVAYELDVTEEQVKAVLLVLQGLEPIGIGARNLHECLLIQLNYLESAGIKQPHAREIISHHLVELGEHKFGKIAQDMKISQEDVSDVWEFVKSKLNPHPAHGFSETNARDRDTRAMYILPDVIIAKGEEDYEVEVVESRRFLLRVNPMYTRMSTELPKTGNLSAEDKRHVQQYVGRAKLFIANINQRRQTIHNITNCLVEKQRDFLEKGVRHLRPLSRAAIAADLGIHESTVSRATAAKYVMLPDGEVIPFAHFFTPSLSVKDIMKEMIEKEGRPLTDAQIAERLRTRGIDIARRTVAKYRMQLDILPSSLR